MIPIFVINLDRSPDRLAAVTDTFHRANLPFQRWAAIDGACIPEPLRRYFSDQYPLTPGEVGCYASHIAIWEHMARSGMPVALVCEDDIDVPPHLASTLADILAAAPTDWEVIKLSSRTHRAVHSLAQIDGHTLVRYWRVPMWTGAYLIASAGARKLLAFQGTRQAVDGDMARPWLFDNLNVLGVSPPPILQRRDTSIIAEMGGRAHRRPWRRHVRLSVNRLQRVLYNMRVLGPKNAWRCFLADQARQPQTPCSRPATL